MNTRFCPKCGSEKGPFVKGFCTECFLKDNDLVKIDTEMEVERCVKCAKINLKGVWKEDSAENIEQWLAGKVKLKEITDEKITVILDPEEGYTNAKVIISGELRGEAIRLEKEIKLKFKDTQCLNCSKLSGDYYEAIIQMRFDGKMAEGKAGEFESMLAKILGERSKTDGLATVVNVTHLKTGADFLIGSKKAAKNAAEKIAKKFNTKVISSYTLIGVDKTGKEKIRHTHCVRVK
ncbi:MAG: NMD3-related protein [Candidatus Diapherotrites archaeon]